MRWKTAPRRTRPFPWEAMELQRSALPATGPGALSSLGEAMAATALPAAKFPRTRLKSGQSCGRG
eukprot:9557583-Alexandrium_andersonii.AAC.1